MAYIAAADLRERTRKPWANDIILSEGDGTDAYIDLIITQVTGQVELELRDDFEPPGGDADETAKFDSFGGDVFRVPRRVRSITTLQTRQAGGTTMTTQTSYYHARSLNAAGTAMATDDQGGGRKFDRLEALPGFSIDCWPYGPEMVWVTGKFGWAAVPDDIKRLVALRTYDLVKNRADPLTTVSSRISSDGTIVYGPSREMEAIVAKYQRGGVYVG